MMRPDASEAQRDELFRGAKPTRAQSGQANQSSKSVTSNTELLQVGRELHEETTGTLQRGLQILNETQQIQDQTLSVLHDQTKQMHRIEGDLDKMKHDVRYSEKVLTYMSHCCCLQCCFTDPEAAKQKAWEKNVQKRHMEEEAVFRAPPIAEAKRTTGKQQAAAAVADKYGAGRPAAVNTEGLAKYGYGEHAEAIDEETRKQDQYLDQISDGLDRLAMGAQTMQNALARQEKPLEQLVEDADHMNVRVQGMNKDSLLRQYRPRK